MAIITIDTSKFDNTISDQNKELGMQILEISEFMLAKDFPHPVVETYNLDQFSNELAVGVGRGISVRWADDTYYICNWADWLEVFKHYKWVAGPEHPWEINKHDCDKFAFHFASMMCWVWKINSIVKCSGFLTYTTADGVYHDTDRHAYCWIVAKDEIGVVSNYLYDPMYNYWQKVENMQAYRMQPNRLKINYKTYDITTI